MKEYLYYSTFATAIITTCRGNVYERTFYECHELEWFRNWARDAMDEDMIEIPSKSILAISFIDSKTGELLMACSHQLAGPTVVDDWEDEEYEDDDYDVGYDHNLKCHTWDE